MSRNDRPKKAKAPGGQAGGFQGNTKTIKAQCSTKSTTSEAQRQRVLEALRMGPQTTHDLRCLGIYQAPARVIELRRRGYHIVTERVVLWDRDGFEHRNSGLYRLEEEPEQRLQTGSKVVP
jgi:hypothetical protein